jgi:hypothetical protein
MTDRCKRCPDHRRARTRSESKTSACAQRSRSALGSSRQVDDIGRIQVQSRRHHVACRSAVMRSTGRDGVAPESSWTAPRTTTRRARSPRWRRRQSHRPSSRTSRRNRQRLSTGARTTPGASRTFAVVVDLDEEAFVLAVDNAANYSDTHVDLLLRHTLRLPDLLPRRQRRAAVIPVIRQGVIGLFR